MTKLLDKALETAQKAPSEIQDDVARMILAYSVRLSLSSFRPRMKPR